jgi:hypothetical protein
VMSLLDLVSTLVLGTGLAWVLITTNRPRR